MKIIVVSGAIANKHRAAGAIWTRLNWTLGFQQLGFEVYFIEEIAPEACVDAAGAQCGARDSANAQVFRKLMQRFGMAERSRLLCDGEVVGGGTSDPLLDIVKQAEALINISGHLTSSQLLSNFRKRVYIDLDPGFTQIWEATGISGARLQGHDFFFTIGENIGAPGCTIPTGNYQWIPIRQPVVLDLWPATPGVRDGAFRTIASWRGPYGPLEYGGQRLGLKAHEWRKFIELPRRSSGKFDIALDIHPGDWKDRDALIANGWELLQPAEVAGDLDSLQRFVRESLAEFSVAQGVYVGTNSGWVSDRTVCYLASGRPALVQETGFSRNYTTGAGLVPFSSIDEAIAGVESITRDYEAHCKAARDIAEREFDARKVLGELAAAIGISP